MCYVMRKDVMQKELPFRGEKGFESIAEILPGYTERLLERVEAAKNYPPIPDDEAGQLKWVEDNL